MFDFFIALFGGAYWTGKFAHEKSICNSYERNRKTADEINLRLRATLPQELEIEQRLKNPQTRDEALEEISSELHEIYGNTWRDEFNDDSRFDKDIGFIYSPWGKAFHLLLSQQGKLPRMFSYNYSLGGLGEQRMNFVIQTCQIIERNIQKIYPELRIMFVPGAEFGTSNPMKYYDELYMGELWWEHNIPPTNRNWNPPIRRIW